MTWIYSLRMRLIVLYTGLILLGFGGLALWAGQQIETAAQEDFEHRTESDVAIVARALTDSIAHFLEGEATQDQVSQILDNYAQETGSQLNLINNQDRVWLSTYEVTDSTYVNLPEIITARENRITHETRHDSEGNWMIYTAAPIIEDGRMLSVVQLIVPLSDVQASIRQRRVTLGAGIVVMGLVVVVVSVLLSASLTRPLARLRHATVQISEGDFSTHLPDTGRDEIGQVARTFNAMSERVQAMLEEQRAFASNVSHELRTPITAIQLRIEALLTDQLDTARQTRYLEEAQAEIQRMNNLVNDLILLSRFDAGSVEIGRDRVDLSRFARQLIKEMQPHADAKAITMTLDAEDNLPPVSANLTHLHVVFRNILDNAIKYMGEDGGRIHWQMRLQNGYIVSDISDTGQGIAPEELEQVLRRFYRADKARSRAVPGAGLGLSLVQSVVHTYGGEISLSSAGVGTGMTVRVTWQAAVQT